MARQSTPWGAVQHSETLAEGIISYSTAGHGGIWLSKARRDALPEWARVGNFLKTDEWWEEDCDWVVPFLYFGPDICAYAFASGDQKKAFYYGTNLAHARRIAEHYKPDFWAHIMDIDTQEACYPA